jgi:hypothetical protein
LFWTLLLVLSVSSVFGRNYAYPWEKKFFASAQTLNYQIIADLNGPWEDVKGKAYYVPFCNDEKSELLIKKDFFLHYKPHDTLVLYFEGLAWSAEIYLNDQLITLTNHPFKEYFIPLSPQLLNAQWNKLEVKMRKSGPSYPLFPRRMIGIHKPAFVLQSAELLEQNFGFPELQWADSTLIYAPYSEAWGYNVSPSEFRQDLKKIKSLGYHSIYLPFRPSNELYQIMSEELVRINPRLGKFVQLFRDYPMELPDQNVRSSVLSSKRGAAEVRAFRQVVHNKGFTDPDWFKLTILLLGLTPVLLLTCWKLIDERTYELLVQLIPKRQHDSAMLREPASLSRGFIFFTLIVRMLIYCAIGFSTLELLNQLERLDWLNIFSFESASYRLYSRYGQYKGLLILVLFMFICSINVLKFFVLQSVSLIFNVKELAIRVVSAENFANFPTVLYLSLISCGLLIVPKPTTWVLFVMFLVLLVIHIVRKNYRSYMGLKYIAHIPSFINFLYLFLFEVLPWIFVL